MSFNLYRVITLLVCEGVSLYFQLTFCMFLFFPSLFPFFLGVACVGLQKPPLKKKRNYVINTSTSSSAFIFFFFFHMFVSFGALQKIRPAEETCARKKTHKKTSNYRTKVWSRRNRSRSASLGLGISRYNLISSSRISSVNCCSLNSSLS